MNTSHTNPKSDPGAELRAGAVHAMLESMKESLLPLRRGRRPLAPNGCSLPSNLSGKGLNILP